MEFSVAIVSALITCLGRLIILLFGSRDIEWSINPMIAEFLSQFRLAGIGFETLLRSIRCIRSINRYRRLAIVYIIYWSRLKFSLRLILLYGEWWLLTVLYHGGRLLCIAHYCLLKVRCWLFLDQWLLDNSRLSHARRFTLWATCN